MPARCIRRSRFALCRNDSSAPLDHPPLCPTPCPLPLPLSLPLNPPRVFLSPSVTVESSSRTELSRDCLQGSTSNSATPSPTPTASPPPHADTHATLNLCSLHSLSLTFAVTSAVLLQDASDVESECAAEVVLQRATEGEGQSQRHHTRHEMHRQSRGIRRLPALLTHPHTGYTQHQHDIPQTPPLSSLSHLPFLSLSAVLCCPQVRALRWR